MRPELLALWALVPLFLGPAPAEGNALTARLCGGGTIDIPLDRDRDSGPEQACFKACHAPTCRKRSGTGAALETD